MTVDALAPCTSRPSTVMWLSMQDKQIIVSYGEIFPNNPGQLSVDDW